MDALPEEITEVGNGEVADNEGTVQAGNLERELISKFEFPPLPPTVEEQIQELCATLRRRITSRNGKPRK